MKHPTQDIEKKVGVAGCKHTTKDLILGLEREGYNIDHVITIDPDKGEQQEVAGYMDLRPFLEEKGITYTVANKYSFKSDEDRENISALGLDILLCMGWQRLIPEWFLESLSIGAFGMHGSSKPLPHGRGRSPMNWSLIQGKQIFYTHLFKYQPGVDDGEIAGVQTFDITEHDTCLTLHFKNTLAMIRLCAKTLPGLMDGSAKLEPQPKEGVSFYPKRTPEDGIIHWEDSSQEIYNLVRAVTRPFPGAFSYLDDEKNNKVMIWEVIPFDTKIVWEGHQPGEIVEVFFDGSVVVKTGDSSLMVKEYDGPVLTYRDIGRRFGHLNKPRKVWEDLPE